MCVSFRGHMISPDRTRLAGCLEEADDEHRYIQAYEHVLIETRNIRTTKNVQDESLVTASFALYYKE